MKQGFLLSKGQISPMGVTVYSDYINIAISFSRKPLQECGIILYDGNKRLDRILFSDSYMVGLVYAVRIDGIKAKNLNYQFFIDGEIWIDPYAKQILGRERWGKYNDTENQLKAVGMDYTQVFDWEDDASPCILYENSIMYSLHVRGFTKHTSSKVKYKGTYEGLVEKIPYLKDLGINSILCMPFYEFDEIIKNPSYRVSHTEIQDSIKEFMSQENGIWKYRINYWGFGDKGNYYMAPKSSYASMPQEALNSVKQMIKEMHKNGIEVLMQVYFAKDLADGFIQDVLRYWVSEYHIDGFQVLGVELPVTLLSKDPVLGKTKLIFENTLNAGADGVVKDGYDRNIARYSDEFRFDVRKYLKGDEDMLYSMSQKLRENSETEGIIHHITDYRGFTLHDLVSYDRKHNEENGEDNRDGSDYNYSWNCGQEGPSRKKAVRQLRLSQKKNAMAMLLLGQATPLILAGDEFGHTTGGNNNAYCQDNKTNWLNWSKDSYHQELYTFVKECIAFRKLHPILHRKELMRIMDTISCGYPDISYHADQAWYTRFENYNRHLGIMYCGLYESINEKTDDFIYFAMNMHWNSHEFALPQLPFEYEWKIDFITREQVKTTEQAQQQSKKLYLPARSIAVLTASKNEKRIKKEKLKSDTKIKKE